MKYSPSWASLSSLLTSVASGAEIRRILIVEDENWLRQSLEEALLSLGFDVDALEGVERSELPLKDYDLAFLDNYFLSKTLTGVGLTPELRRSCPQILIVAMSSHDGKNAEMIRLGANLAVKKGELRRLVT